MNCMENILRLIFKPFKYAQTVGATIWMLHVHGTYCIAKVCQNTKRSSWIIKSQIEPGLH